MRCDKVRTSREASKLSGAGNVEKDYLMKVIALAGVYNSGKTTVLNELIGELKNRNASAVPNKTKIPSSYSGNDCRELLSWSANNGNAYIIGVCTGGDLASIINDNFTFFVDNQCDICITACRAAASSDTVVEVIKESSTRFHRLPYFVAKMRTADAMHNKVDSQTVEQLLDMIS